MKNPMYLDPWSQKLRQMRGWTYGTPSRMLRLTFRDAHNARDSHRMIGLRLFRGIE